MDEVSDLELGPSQELAVGLGGEEIGEEPKVGVGRLAEGLVDPVGEFGLVGGQGEPGHGSPP